ncbi:hypothetical protein [Corallococcus sp. CA054B]|uniref:hypothetical protein n=1 Tax=Corallococcus sp. CA054B TaxID=2316734 RepID=UPI0011C448E2|nr:hypothetical protein [Corallococcus sp. CA054B]
MRAAIIAGLMAVGMLAGCGGPASDEQAAGATASVDALASACLDACKATYVACMRAAHGSTSEQQACTEDYVACNQSCSSPSATQHEGNQVHAAGLPPDNICHIECWGGPAAGTTAAPYAATLQECFNHVNDICAVASGGWYFFTYNGQSWAN